MQIRIITLFPEMFAGFFNYSIIKRAIDKKLVTIDFINPRDFTTDNYKTVDDKPYGGGVGMVMKIEPIYKALGKVKRQKAKGKSSSQNSKVILTSPRGKVFDQQKAQNYAKLDHLIIITGHYEGVDQRISDHIDEEISIGDFVVSGGEIAAVAIIDSVIRLIPKVINQQSIVWESFTKINTDQLIDIVGSDEILVNLKKNNIKNVKLLEYPQYTRPAIFKDNKVPEILFSGDHKKIDQWRIKQAYQLTKKNRPDLLRS